jgi:hypothetical protein
MAMEWNAQNSPDRLAISKGTFSAARLASSVNSIGSLERQSKIRANVEMPLLESVQASGREIVLNVYTTYGTVAIVQATDYQVGGIGMEKINAEGTYSIDIYKKDDGTVALELVE